MHFCGAALKVVGAGSGLMHESGCIQIQTPEAATPDLAAYTPQA